MSATQAPSATRIGALDGLRALAVTAVIVYHLSPGSLPSGFLGVDVFMVVSGFIVTTLLTREHDSTGRVRLGAFWGRRFRRLVPALMVLIVVVTVWVHWTGPATLIPPVRSQGLAALFYVTNWRLIAQGVTYGGALASTSPFVHLWSLAVEEQFYLAWPLLLIALLTVSRGRRRLVVGATALAGCASALWMAYLFDPSRSTVRVYYGTDTRAQAFLFGAAMALAIPLLGPRARGAVRWCAPAALCGVVLLMVTNSPGLLYRGGFALVAAGTAIVAAATTLPGGVQHVLNHRPLRGLGRVSYGAYLWHWPAIVLLTPARVGIAGVDLLLLRLGVTGAATAASWCFVERPIALFRPRRVAFTGAAVSVSALVALVVLPAGQSFAFSTYRTDQIRAPVVVTPTTVRVARERAHPAPTTTRAPPSTGALALPSVGTAMIVGDSGMYSAQPAFTAALSAAGWRVVQTAYPGVGLTNPPGEIAHWATTVEQYHPDLTIVMVGSWDLTWETTHGPAAFRGLVNQAVGAFTATGGKVLWLSILPGGVGDDRSLDHFFAELPARDPGVVEYLDIQAALRAPGGGWPRVVDGRALRGRDGWHLCPDGAAAVTHLALAHIGLDRGTWDQGGWRDWSGYEPGTNTCTP